MGHEIRNHLMGLLKGHPRSQGTKSDQTEIRECAVCALKGLIQHPEAAGIPSGSKGWCTRLPHLVYPLVI